MSTMEEHVLCMNQKATKIGQEEKDASTSVYFLSPPHCITPSISHPWLPFIFLPRFYEVFNQVIFMLDYNQMIQFL